MKNRKRLVSKRVRIIRWINTVLVGLLIALAILLLLNGCANDIKAIDVDEPSTSKQEVLDSKPTYSNKPSTSTTPETVLSAPAVKEWEPNQEDVDAIAKTLWGECRGVPYTSHKAAVVWCILNRVDEGGYFGSSIIEVVSKPNQFIGYNANHPVDPELEEIARDVLKRWHAEKEGETNVGRVLPSGYCYFVGDGELNYFTNEWKSKNYWDWSLPNPYES